MIGIPKDFTALVSTEFFERLAHFGMKSIVFYFLIASTTAQNPGMGLDNLSAIEIISLFGSLIYMSSILGGWLSDRIFGLQRTIIIRGILIFFGHFILALLGKYIQFIFH